jgi:hypothetical protein
MRSIDVFIQGAGFDDIIVTTAEPHQSIDAILRSLERPVPRDDKLLIFMEDLSAPLDVDVVVEELLPLAPDDESIGGSLRLHVAYCRQVEVSVRFNGEEVKRHFPPGATIARVHHWAARRAFHLSPRDAAEHVLQLQGTVKRPDRDVHIGTLTAGIACALAFDLVPRKRVEG